MTENRKGKIILAQYWKLHDSPCQRGQQQQKKLHLLPPLPCSYTNSSHRNTPGISSKSTHTVQILVLFIYLIHLLFCFAMCKVAKTSLVKRHRLCMHCVPSVLIHVVLRDAFKKELASIIFKPVHHHRNQLSLPPNSTEISNLNVRLYKPFDTSKIHDSLQSTLFSLDQCRTNFM